MGGGMMMSDKALSRILNDLTIYTFQTRELPRLRALAKKRMYWDRLIHSIWRWRLGLR
jgi:hypothetical protein